MVHVDYKGRMGNQLFMYAVGRTIAERLGYRLNAKPIPGFDGTNEFVDGQMYMTPVQYLYGDYVIDPVAMFANQRPRMIYLQAYAQNYACFADRSDDVRKWFYPGLPDQGPRADDVVMHIRLSDFVTPYKWALSFDYYEHALNNLFPTRKNLYIITDEPDSPLLACLDKYSPTYYNAPTLEQFKFMTLAKQLIIGTSTFSWWAAFLSSGAVVAPLMKRGYYFKPDSKNENYVVKEDRYTYVEDVELLEA